MTRKCLFIFLPHTLTQKIFTLSPIPWRFHSYIHSKSTFFPKTHFYVGVFEMSFRTLPWKDNFSVWAQMLFCLKSQIYWKPIAPSPTSLTASQTLWPQQPAKLLQLQFIFLPKGESRNGILGLWDLITEQNPASFNRVMDLGFHYSLCKERFHRKHHQKEKMRIWSLKLAEVHCPHQPLHFY